MAKRRAPHCKPADIRAAAEAYRALHDGIEPTEIECRAWDVRKPRFEVELGPMPENRYIKKHVEENEPRKDVYRHINFEELQKTDPALAEEYMPVLVHNDRGEMRIEQSHRGRNYTVTSHGIEDIPMHDNDGDGYGMYGIRRNASPYAAPAEAAAEQRRQAEMLGQPGYGGGYRPPAPTTQGARSFFTDMAIIGGWAGGATILGAMAMRDTRMSHPMKATLTGVVATGTGLAVNQKAPRIAIGLAAGGVANLLQALFETMIAEPVPAPAPLQTSAQQLVAAPAISAPLPAQAPVQLNAPPAIAPAGHVSRQGINLMMRGR